DFCLICSKNEDNDLCQTCQTICQFIEHRPTTISQIYIGQLTADSPIMIDCVFGTQSINIQNSCFCNRYLLELCQKMNSSTISLNNIPKIQQKSRNSGNNQEG
ncbi:unnamed protein product, partial [Adineta steineri]